MKNKATVLSIVWLCLILSSSIQAQNTFGLQELIHRALKQNADVQIQNAQTRISALERGQAISHLLPTLDAEGGYIYSTYRNGNPDFVGANGQKETLAYLSLHQPIFNADALGQFRKNSLEQKKQSVVLNQVRQDVILNVVRGYFNNLKLEGELEALKENLHSFQLMYKQTQLLFESGSVPELDVKKSHVEYLLQKNGLHQAEKEYQAGLNQLKELVGFSISDSLKIRDFSTQEVPLDSLPIYKKNALQNSPEWQALQLEKKQALLQRQTALLSNLPAIDANLYYGWDANPPLSQKNNGWQAMLNISLPLWRWGAQKADYEIAGLRVHQIEQVQKKLEKQILQKVINTYNEARLQQAQISTMTEGKNEAEQAVRMAKIGYQEGSVTNLELINTQKIFTRSRIEHLAAFYNFYTAKAALLRSAGMLTEDLAWIQK